MHIQCAFTQCPQKQTLSSLVTFACWFAFFFFSLGWGRLWVWWQFGTRIGTVHFFIANLKRFDKSWQRIGKNCQSLKPSKLTRIGTFHFFIVNLKRFDKSWQRIRKNCQSLKPSKLTRIGTFHFFIANLKRFDESWQRIRKNCQSLKPSKFTRIGTLNPFYCKFKKNWTTNRKILPIFQYHKFG